MIRPGAISRLMIRTLLTPLWIAVRLHGAGVLERERVLVDPRRPSSRSATIFWRADDEDHPAGARDIRAKLTAAHRGRDEQSRLGDGVDAAEHHVRGRGHRRISSPCVARSMLRMRGPIGSYRPDASSSG